MITLLFVASTLFTFSSCDKKISTNPTQTQGQNTPTDTAFTRTITFLSLDSLLITAEHYHLKQDAPVIVLCHQAGYSRGEYTEIAPKLVQMGFNCIAIDQRSGGSINGVINRTNQRAVAKSIPTSFNDAKQDIEAAVKWAKNHYKRKVILWGSSYSSSLSLILAKEMAEVEKVLSFSPGEYLNPVNVTVYLRFG